MRRSLSTPSGPFRADQIRSGDPYELSKGHAIQCMTTGGRGSRANLLGGSVLDSDPAVEEAGVDTGYSPSPDNLRAPDVAVGNVPDAPGWVSGAPPLAVEYADTGQDEAELTAKIGELFTAGTQLIWVVRLVGPRRVEVHEPGKNMQLLQRGDVLTAPGILRNPVPVEALYDRDAAHEATLHNLLERRGYSSLNAVREEGKEEGREEGKEEGREEGREETLRESILTVLDARGLAVDDQARANISDCCDLKTLQNWLVRAATVTTLAEVFSA